MAIRRAVKGLLSTLRLPCGMTLELKERWTLRGRYGNRTGSAKPM